MTTITLTIPDDLARHAEAHARQTGQSLAEVIEQALVASVGTAPAPITLSPQVQALFGSLQAPAGLDYRNELMQALEERYSQ